MPAACAARCMSCASLNVSARGFSHSTCRPDAMTSRVMAWWYCGGPATYTRSRSAAASRLWWSVQAEAESVRAVVSARAAFTSHTAVTCTSGWAVNALSRLWPMAPRPITPTRTGETLSCRFMPSPGTPGHFAAIAPWRAGRRLVASRTTGTRLPRIRRARSSGSAVKSRGHLWGRGGQRRVPSAAACCEMSSGVVGEHWAVWVDPGQRHGHGAEEVVTVWRPWSSPAVTSDWGRPPSVPPLPSRGAA